MKLQEILSITSEQLLPLKMTEVTKLLGVSGMVITKELKKHDFKLDNLTGLVSYNDLIVFDVKKNAMGSNTERLKQCYLFLAEVKAVLEVMSDPEKRAETQFNIEEEAERQLNLDSTDFPFVLPDDTKTFKQIKNSIKKYYLDHGVAINE